MQEGEKVRSARKILEKEKGEQERFRRQRDRIRSARKILEKMTYWSARKISEKKR